MKTKVTRFFSWPLFKSDIKSNWVLILVIMVIMMGMSTVLNYASSIMGSDTDSADYSSQEKEFYTYLSGLAAYDMMTDQDLSYDDFIKNSDHTAYETAFGMISQQLNEDLTVDGFQKAIDDLEPSETSMDTYVQLFEYNFALASQKGVFSKDTLTADGLMNTMFDMLGVDTDLIETMSSGQSSSLINTMYYTAIGLLPIFLLIVILGNSMIAEQVDRGSLAYILSTPTTRRAVAWTQALFMILVPLVVLIPVCISRIVTTQLFFGEVNAKMICALYGGMYLLCEAVAGICYLGSCIFSRSKHSMSFGGGLTVWFFLAALLGIFGSQMMIDLGIGVEELSVFNHLTLVGLFDVDALSTVGTAAVDYSFGWKLAVLLLIAVVSYVVGSKWFEKKDLPL